MKVYGEKSQEFFLLKKKDKEIFKRIFSSFLPRTMC
jgi:hypothetical protein